MTRNDICNDGRGIEFLGIECAWPSQATLGPSRLRPRRRAPLWRSAALALALALAAAGVWQLGQAGYIQAKAWLAQVLIRDAWSRTLAGERRVKPWPWADTWPVARLSAPARGIELYVLAGADGRSIAFGPGHMFGSAAPGTAGNTVIGAHRDTHFAFLQWLDRGELLEIETPQGRRVRYRVSARQVVRQDDTRLLEQDDGPPTLTLVTCYPFDALRAGGPLRYVVTAHAVEAAGPPRA